MEEITIDHAPLYESKPSHRMRRDSLVERRFDTLVLEGGGVLGSAYVGAIEELERNGTLGCIENFGGTSVGAIFAGLLAVGADNAFIHSQWDTLEFTSFVDYGSWLSVIYRALRYFGAIRGDYFTTWYRGLIEKLTGDGNITLGEIHKRYGGRLVIATVNMTRRELTYLDHLSNPKLPLVTAVRMSTAISFLMEPVEYEGCLYVDGGLLDNFPVRAFNGYKVLGLMLVTNNEEREYVTPITGLPSFTIAHLEVLLNNPQKIHVDEEIWKSIIKIPVYGYRSTDFDISQSAKSFLVSNGSHSVFTFFNK